MAVKLQQLNRGYGIDNEASYNTPSNNYLHLSNLNTGIMSPATNFENNQTEQGKGSDFATQNYAVSRTSSGTLERYGDSTSTLWMLAKALGNSSDTGSSAPYSYSIVPQDLVNSGNGIQLPSFSVVEQLIESGSTAVSNLYTGCVMDSVSIGWTSGAGRSSVKVTGSYTGSGKVASASAITLPALNQDYYMLAANMSLTILGTNYVNAKTINSGNWTWNNNLDASNGYFPGSGVDASGFAYRGRMEAGTNRKCGFDFTVRLLNNSVEYSTLMALTSGEAVIGFQHASDTNNAVTLTLPAVQYNVVEYGQENGTATVKVTAEVLYNGSNPLVTVTGKCGTGGF
jgi:hypothetical protein